MLIPSNGETEYGISLERSLHDLAWNPDWEIDVNWYTWLILIHFELCFLPKIKLTWSPHAVPSFRTERHLLSPFLPVIEMWTCFNPASKIPPCAVHLKTRTPQNFWAFWKELCFLFIMTRFHYMDCFDRKQRFSDLSNILQLQDFARTWKLTNSLWM